MVYLAMKLVTIVWSTSITVPDTFDPANPSDQAVALEAGWQSVSKSDGEITDCSEE